jgi:hypothetical protein
MQNPNVIDLISYQNDEKPELGQLVRTMGGRGAAESIAKAFIQNAQFPDLHRSTTYCRRGGIYPRGYRPICDRKFSAQVCSPRAANHQVSASHDRSVAKRDPSRDVIDLISYQNDEKGCTAIIDKVEKA